MKRLLSISLCLVLLLSALCLSGCKATTLTEIPLGGELPSFQLERPVKEVNLSDSDTQQNIVASYAGEGLTVTVFKLPNTSNLTLREYGTAQAEKLHVYCNLVSYEKSPAANICYADTINDKPCLVRSYIFSGKGEFVKINLNYETAAEPLGKTGKTIRFITGYSKSNTESSPFKNETLFTYEEPYLSTTRIREFDKTQMLTQYDPALFPKTGKDGYDKLEANGWTLEEFITLYGQNHELKKGELIKRNGLDVAFIGYVENGHFFVHAFIDCGDSYVDLTAENDADHFQHLTNAMLDTVA